MTIDSILKAPLGAGLVLERVICANGDVVIDIRDAEGSEVFVEEIIRIARPGPGTALDWRARPGADHADL